MNQTSIFVTPNKTDLSFVKSSTVNLNHSAIQPHSSLLVSAFKEETKNQSSFRSSDTLDESEDPAVLFETMRLNGHSGIIDFSQIHLDNNAVANGKMQVGSWLGVKVAVKKYNTLSNNKLTKEDIMKAMLNEVEKL